MATIVPIITYPQRGRIQIEWLGLVPLDDGVPVEVPRYGEKCVHIVRAIPNTAICGLQGSHNGILYRNLLDALGASVFSTGTAMFQILESPSFMKPLVITGAGGPFAVRLTASVGLS